MIFTVQECMSSLDIGGRPFSKGCLMDNNILRRTLKQRRRHIQHRTLANAHLTRHILQQPVFQRANRIAAYIPCRGEADPVPALLNALYQRKIGYLPVLHPYIPRRLLFAPWTPATPMYPNRYGILEPAYTLVDCIKPTLLDLVLTPLLGFDEQGHRLGMGGGYYDRTFAFRRHRQHWRRPYLLGIAFDEQYCASFEVNSWDVALDAVITPSWHYVGIS